jgi:hypothetical protein
MKVLLSSFQLTQPILDHVAPALREGDIDTCIEWTDRIFGMVPKSPFHIVRDLDFTTCPEDTAKKFDEWVLSQEAVRSFGSTYTETNGFAHNAGRWYFNWFAYEAAGSADDFAYLGDGWISEEHEDVVLTGMEALQMVFRTEWIDEEDFARQICECQVVFKFMRLIQSVAANMKQFRHPLVVSSHDWETFLRINPVPKQKAEQDGTGQPATRPESDSEGGDKPQPESEERSR